MASTNNNVVSRRQPEAYINDVVTAHNIYRKKHGKAEDLVEDRELSATAQAWADHLAATKQMKHSTAEFKGQPKGENLASMWSSNCADFPGQQAVKSWYDEIEKYSFDSPGFSQGTGHFTQVVWKGSKKVGVGKASTPDGHVYVVCNYLPAGNFKGEFKENVIPANTKEQAAERDPQTFIRKEQPVPAEANNNTISRRLPEPYINDVVTAHNMYRKKHGQVGDLVEDRELSATAQAWADHLAATKQMKHSPCKFKGGPMGENIAYRWSSNCQDFPGQEAVKGWYDEVKLYSFDSHGFAQGTGHFTQVVWKGSKKVGVGKASTPDGHVYVVCDYLPVGNVMGQFKENVNPA